MGQLDFVYNSACALVSVWGRVCREGEWEWCVGESV